MVTIEQAVVFAILLQNEDGILGKAPTYIAEKLELCKLEPNPKNLLDSNNQRLFDAWRQR